MTTLFQDLRYGIRMLARNRGFTAVAVATLALGIGATTATFSVVDTVLLRPLPFPHPERLVSLEELRMRQLPAPESLSYPDFFDWRAQNRVFERMTAYHDASLTLTGRDRPLHLVSEVVTSGFFETLDVMPLLGRGFLLEDEKPGSRTVVLSHDFWRMQLASDPNIVGKTLTLDGQSFTVVGVMPQGFRYPIESPAIELWTCISRDAESGRPGGEPMTSQRGAHFLAVSARLKPGVTFAGAQSEMDSIARGLAAKYPDSNAYLTAVRMRPELESLVGDVRRPLLVLLGAVGFLLLIACANVANLLLARATSRQKEIAIRAALGAGRRRVARQLLTESVLLAAVGGALGLLLAAWGTRLLVQLSPVDVPRLSQAGVDGRILLFAFLASFVTGIAFGIIPALRTSRSDLAGSLKEGGRSFSEGLRHNRARAALVVAEVALALSLLVGSGLLIRSFVLLRSVNPGFIPRNVLTFTFLLPSAKYDKEHRITFDDELLTRLNSLPGVRSAAGVLPLPLSGNIYVIAFEIEGRPASRADRPEAEFRMVSPGYFRTMGIPVLKGREFSVFDRRDAPPVIIINQALARRFFPNQDPLGKWMVPGVSDSGDFAKREIVGVVGDVRSQSLDAKAGPEFYVPYSQCLIGPLRFVVRTEADPRSLVNSVRNEVQFLDKELPVYGVRTLEDYLGASLAQPRFNTFLLSMFAGLALLLTAVGVYGVISYSVAQRTHEIGIRMALGAGQSDVMRMVVRQGALLTGIGLAIGLVTSFLLTRLLMGMIYEVRPTDPWTMVSVSGLLVVVTLLASYIPARRATKVDPMVALRYE